MRSLLMGAAFALFAVPAVAQQSGVISTWLIASAATDSRNEDPALRSRKVIGMPLIWGFDATSDPGTFEGGQIYNGENGKTCSANISLQPDGKLRLRGYVGSPMLGETQLWTRVSQ